MTDQPRPATPEEFEALLTTCRSRPEFTEPAAFGLGVATIADADGSVLDTHYLSVNLGRSVGFAALVHDVCDTTSSIGTVTLSSVHLEEILARGAVHRETPRSTRTSPRAVSSTGSSSVRTRCPCDASW